MLGQLLRERHNSLRPPVIVTSALDIAAVLRGDREALGISGEELDGRIGWADRYTAKAENPNAKWGRHLIRVEPCADEWMQALNRSLVLMDRTYAQELVRQHASSLPDVRGLQRRLVQRLVFA
jgi:hypothetical protein